MWIYIQLVIDKLLVNILFCLVTVDAQISLHFKYQSIVSITLLQKLAARFLEVSKFYDMIPMVLSLGIAIMVNNLTCICFQYNR